eukprot:TRINITY_DN3895_c0_g2_i1.p1 TRINITY_DN3895_c0_g2~~TRINITY_DN3895_c0_g2_i1.p1  ORF type:complete len:628 (+),score=115.99 TRINITY_DN3895_c0_g2_i1:111-1994(+)
MVRFSKVILAGLALLGKASASEAAPPAPAKKVDRSCFHVGVALNDPTHNKAKDVRTTGSAAKCQESCNNETSCAHFTFYRNSGGCWLQAEFTTAFEAADAISGPKNCEKNYDPRDYEVNRLCLYDGVSTNNPEGKTQHRAASATECQARCAKDSECVKFTFVKRTHKVVDGSCWLSKGNDVNVKPWTSKETDAVSGPPSCTKPYNKADFQVCWHDGVAIFRPTQNQTESAVRAVGAGQCQALCDEKVWCTHFMYDKFFEGNNCYLLALANLTKPYVDLAAVSGPASCVKYNKTDYQVDRSCFNDGLALHDPSKAFRGKVKTDTAAECQDVCAQIALCEDFTWNSSDLSCWGLTQADRRLITPWKAVNVTSGPAKCTEKYDKKYYQACFHDGVALNDPKNNAAGDALNKTGTVAECQVLCDNEVSCEHFTFYKSTGGCWLQGNLTNLTTPVKAADAVSGPASCVKYNKTDYQVPTIVSKGLPVWTWVLIGLGAVAAVALLGGAASFFMGRGGASKKRGSAVKGKKATADDLEQEVPLVQMQSKPGQRAQAPQVSSSPATQTKQSARTAFIAAGPEATSAAPAVTYAPPAATYASAPAVAYAPVATYAAAPAVAYAPVATYAAPAVNYA